MEKQNKEVTILFHGKIKKAALVLSLSLILQSLSFLIQPVSVQAAAGVPALQLAAKSAILMEASTGQILFEMNADDAKPPASMAKMMTEYIVLEQISTGKIKWTDPVTVSKYAEDIIGSGGLLAEGEQYTVEDLFKTMSIFSANDGATMLAEYIGGTVEKFAGMMNDKAEELGLSDQAYFIDPTGLSRQDLADSGYTPLSLEGETMLTARDAAILAQRIVIDHPEALKYTSVPQTYLKPGDERYRMNNWNQMLEGWKDFDNNFSRTAYTGLDGMKTGHTIEAGYCFTGTAERDGLRLISVVMGTASEAKRFSETKKILDFGFNNFEKKTVLTAKTEIDALKKVKISKGVETEVSVVTEKGIEFIVKKGETAEAFTTKAKAVEKSKLVAPIKKGDVVGTVTVEYKDSHETMNVNLIAADNVDKASWFRLFFRGIKNFFGDLLSGIKDLF